MAGSSLSATNENRQVFSVGSEVYKVRDVMDAAVFRGEMRPVWNELLRLLACAAKAADTDATADEPAIDSATQTFRYDHDLITAEETERWLADRDLTLADFGDYFDRHYWGEAFRGQAKPDAIEYASAEPELRDLLVAELMLSGEFARMANRYAWRLAVSEQLAEPVEFDRIVKEREQFLDRHELKKNEIPGWLESVGRDEVWLEKMLNLEAAYERQRDRVLTPEACKRELSSLRLQLTIFDVEVIEFDSHDAAREALLCVREDGMSMEEVATEGRYPFHGEQVVLEDIAPEMQQLFLSVTPGQVLEPTELDGAHRLCRVISKSEPNPEDASVRRRIEQRLLDRHFSEAVQQHVRWDLSLT